MNISINTTIIKNNILPSLEKAIEKIIESINIIKEYKINFPNEYIKHETDLSTLQKQLEQNKTDIENFMFDAKKNYNKYEEIIQKTIKQIESIEKINLESIDVIY